MSRRLPKATEETLDDIRRQAAPPQARHDSTESSGVTTETPPAKSQSLVIVLPREPNDRRERKQTDAGMLRRSRARDIIERHAACAAIGGLIPLPILDTVGVMAAVAMMIRALADLYGEPLRRDRAKALAASVAGGLGQAGAGSLTSAALAKLVPGANIAGAMVSSAAALALTRTIGRAFVLHYETGGTALTFDEEALRTYFASVAPSQPTSRQ